MAKRKYLDIIHHYSEIMTVVWCPDYKISDVMPAPSGRI